MPEPERKTLPAEQFREHENPLFSWRKRNVRCTLTTRNYSTEDIGVDSQIELQGH